MFPKHDLRAVEHTDGAHGSRGHETQQAPRGVRTCEPWSTRTAHTAHEEEGHETQQAPRGVVVSRVPSHHVSNSPQSVITHFLVSLKGSVSPMRETPRATGSIASDCFSETRVAQKAADCQPAKPSSLSRLALGVALSPGAYHGTASSQAPHGRKTHSHTQSVCG